MLFLNARMGAFVEHEVEGILLLRAKRSVKDWLKKYFLLASNSIESVNMYSLIIA